MKSLQDTESIKNNASNTSEVSESELISSKELIATSFAIPLSRAFVVNNEIDIDQLLPGKVRYVSDGAVADNSDDAESFDNAFGDPFEDIAAEGSL